jgi:hypothetical protein
VLEVENLKSIEVHFLKTYALIVEIDVAGGV